MKKNIFLLSIIIILAIVAYYLVRADKKADKNYDFSYREFAVENVDGIHFINIFKRNDQPLNFQKKGDKWYVNEKYLVDENPMQNILAVFKRIRIKYVPPDAAVENIMKSMIGNSIKVELYDKNHSAIKKFYVGGSPENSNGTYFVMEGSSKPLVMDMPGFKGNLRVRFNYTLDEWRDKSVISENPEKISEIDINYFMDKNSSFKLKKDDNGMYQIYPFYNEQEKMEGIPDQKFVKSYLLGFENKKCEYIENSMPDRDEIVSRSPILEIKILRNDKSSRTLEFFMLPKLDEETQNDKSGLDKYLNQHVLRYLVRSDDGDLFLVQYEVFKDIFVKYQGFFNN